MTALDTWPPQRYLRRVIAVGAIKLTQENVGQVLEWTSGMMAYAPTGNGDEHIDVGIIVERPGRDPLMVTYGEVLILDQSDPEVTMWVAVSEPTFDRNFRGQNEVITEVKEIRGRIREEAQSAQPPA